ncbi:hypothetical protein B0H10DRAFT_1363560 [Mycena sp. CBHHK59/15]|nr:hypothetical protein B0H10DRAFT_1363560 [Mycena sp. CBHHK59/15]
MSFPSAAYRSTITPHKRLPQMDPESRRCLFAMCTHAHPKIGCNVDPTDPTDQIVLKEKPPVQSYVCTPRRCVPQVPQEIIDAIVDNVDDVASFKACALVCWAFVPISRTHIFRAISLDMLNDAPHRFYALLRRSPYIALYVKDLTIFRSHDTSLWMQPGSPLPQVLSLLPHIVRLSIFGCWGDWHDVPPLLASALLRVLACGKLERLHILTAANVPVALLHSALQVRVLSLFHVSLDPRDDPRRLHAPPPGAAPAFLNLSLDSKVGKILEHVGPTRLTHVRRLALNPIPNSVNSAANMARVLSAVEGTLERLDIQVHESHFEPIDTSRLTALRTFQLHVILAERPALPHTPPPSSAAPVSSAPSSPTPSSPHSSPSPPPQSEFTFAPTAAPLIPPFLPLILARLRAANPLLTSLTIVLHVPAVSGPALCARDVRLLREVDAVLFGGAGREGADEGDSGRRGSGVALRSLHVRVVPEASPPTLLPPYAAFVRAHLPRAARACGAHAHWRGDARADGEERGLRVETGYRVRGAAVMPLLPYTSVWPHRPRK